MFREDTVTMSGKELRRVHVIRKVQDQQLTQGEAARLLGLTDRQIRRLMRRVEQEGDAVFHMTSVIGTSPPCRP